LRFDPQQILSDGNKTIDQAVRFINSVQHGDVQPIKTSYEHLNDMHMGGIFPQSITTIVARPSHGKTYFMYRLTEDIMSDELNPSLSKAMLIYNWEMSTPNILLSKFKVALKKPFSKILSEPFSEEEKQIVKEITDNYRDERVIKVDRVLTPQYYYETTKYFLEQNKDKDYCFVATDHVGMVLKGSSSKHVAMEELLEYQNELKKEYKNSVFINLAQLRRDIELRWRSEDSNPFNHRPNSNDIYNADAMQQVSDVIVALVLPQKPGLDTYSRVKIDNYKHLEEHFSSLGSSGEYVPLRGDNRIYYEYLKVRMDDFDKSYLYAELLNKDQEDLIDSHQDTDVNISTDDIEDDLDF